MGMAHRAPMDTYKRKFNVTEHALQRARERLTEDQKIRFRDDEDLKNALDQATDDAIKQEAFEHITDDKTPAMIVDLGQSSDFSELWALLKPEQSVKPGRPDRYISTCLTSEQVMRNKATSGRNWGHKTSATAKLGSLGTALAPALKKAAALTPVPTSSPQAAKAVSKPEPPQPVSQLAFADPSLVLGLDLSKRLVKRPDGSTEVLTKEAASKAMADHIAAGGDRADFKVYKQGWVEVQGKVKVEVEVEL
jgi:hypothetical protein